MELTLLISFHSFAQQDPSYSMFMYTGTSLNPAMAGSAGSLSGTALYRDQWTGIKGAPITQFLNLDMPVFHDKVGLGLAMYNDQIGVTRNQNIDLQYAYRLNFGKGILAMGLQGGINNYNADFTSVVTNPQNSADHAFADVANSMAFNVGTGVFYYTDKFSLGISVPRLVNHSIDGLNNSNNYRKYYLNASYLINLSEDLIFKPSTLLKIGEGIPFQVDINSTFWYKQRYSVGVSYRSQDSVTGIVQLKVGDDFTVGYAYDYITSSMSKYVRGNNEIMVRFAIPSINNTINQRKF
jgi:type IX secretion system PorP/SprF family membrane protein